ncbi:MAG: hypothetical protein K1X75_15125 [Leptospirales bacterium]|nr:hypothetical protein [Leptospirales bacterium]
MVLKVERNTLHLRFGAASPFAAAEQRSQILDAIRQSHLPVLVSLRQSGDPSATELILLGDVLHAVRTRGGRIHIHSQKAHNVSPSLAALLARAESVLASA